MNAILQRAVVMHLRNRACISARGYVHLKVCEGSFDAPGESVTVSQHPSWNCRLVRIVGLSAAISTGKESAAHEHLLPDRPELYSPVLHNACGVEYPVTIFSEQGQ